MARRCRSTDRRDAEGRCLGASLELAFAAHRRGLAVSLVRWTVQGDPDFIDHWAVRLDGRHVIDLTRAQVDRTNRLVVDIEDYPANFVDRREYPASLFLADYAAVRAADRSTLPAAFMLTMARTRFRFDVMTALRSFFPVRVLTLAAEFAGAHVRVLRQAGLKRLQARREGLVQRLG